MPSLPQLLMSRVLASFNNYSEVEITWEPPANDSRVDVYHYQVINNMRASVILDSTTKNTIVVIDAYEISPTLLFLLSAWNCKGASIPIALFISNGEGC